MNSILNLLHRRAPALGLLLLGFLLPGLASGQTAPTAPSGPTGRGSASAAADAVQLSVFTVTEEKDLGYESMQTTSGLRTVQELKNVANSISIMNSQLMEDLAVIDVNEASKWFVTGEDNPDPALSNRLIFRGIVNNYAMRNGWIWYSPMDSFATERVELLRGPNAFLYGEADLGGANNQVTKRGLFTRNINRVKMMFGSESFRRVELDLNRRLGNKVAMRFAAVASDNDSWINHVRRNFAGLYGAVTYRPFRTTTVSVMAEKSRINSVNAQGLFIENFSFTNVTALTNTAGVVYVPATKQLYRANTMRRSNGTGFTLVDPAILPKTWQVGGPDSTYNNVYSSVTVEVEQKIGKNLNLLLSGNFYQQHIDQWNVTAARNLFRDLSPTLPNGTPNQRYNELYTEYFRTRNINGNIVRDMRLSAVYDLNTKWMYQQFVVNLQQHQDTPGQRKPKWGEYVDPTNPAFVGTVNTAPTQSAFTANRTTFTNNRFMRRYYLRDGDGADLTSDLGPVPGVSAWFPDLSNTVPATGNIYMRRFYTPTWGVGASGRYFKNHLYTLVGFRRDHFNMRTTVGAPQPIANVWDNRVIDGAFAPNPAFVQYKVDGGNYGLVLRLNESFAVSYNHAQSFRISVGEGNLTYNPGVRQSIPTGEGEDISTRMTLFGGRIEFNTTYYNNYQPNARFAPAPVVAVRDEVAAIFPDTFYAAGQDYQNITTKGYEVEIVANLTRQWRLMLNGSTNKVVTENRAPLLKGFQSEAKELGKPTPLLDAFLLTIPEGVPNAGYTKVRANIFTRYTFSQGPIKGLFVGGGANYRQPTFRGNGAVVQGGPVIALWSPGYYVATLLAGYQTKIMNRPTSISLNVSNLFDKEYYLSATTTTGSWGAPRSWRMSVITDF
jgi:outer membrane receptor for ferric coprogen and ferric-rhodotorulic acid